MDTARFRLRRFSCDIAGALRDAVVLSASDVVGILAPEDSASNSGADPVEFSSCEFLDARMALSLFSCINRSNASSARACVFCP